MSSVRCEMRRMRRIVRPQGQGSPNSDVTSRVRNRNIGMACLLSVVSTSSPVSPSGSGWPVSGSTISG